MAVRKHPWQLQHPPRTAYISALQRMTQRELADHCTTILERAIAESQARQIAILAKLGTHPAAYHDTAHQQADQRTTELTRMLQPNAA